MGNEDSETQLESEAKDAEKNIDDNGTPGNQIRVVAFMCSTFSTRLIFTKKRFFWKSVTLRWQC